MKPIIEAKAKANQAAMGGALREKSHEVDAPIRTDEGNAIGGGKSSPNSDETSPMRTDGRVVW